MNVASFFHVCRSAAAIAGVQELTVFGAAAVVPWGDRLGPGDDPWPSLELDVDLGRQDLTDLVDGTIGELSLFHDTHGVYAHGVALDAFVAPRDWRTRAEVFVEPQSRTRVLVPHPQDLAVAKLVRGDEKDWAFARYVVRRFRIPVEDVEHALDDVGRDHPRYAEHARRARALVRTRIAATT